MNAPEVFPAWVRRWLLPLASLGLGVTLFATVFQEVGGGTSHGHHAYSRSAVGYGALVRYLELHGPVLVSRGYATEQAGLSTPLLLLEPPGEELLRLRNLLERALDRDAAGILVLPKWRGLADPDDPERVRAVEPVPVADVDNALAELLLLVDNWQRSFAEEMDLEVVERKALPEVRRVETTSADMSWEWSLPGPPRAPALPAPQLLTGGEDWLEPLLSTDEGILVARVADSDWLVISDPDFLNNAGLARADNAEIALRALLDAPGADGLVIDASLHGFTRADSVWRALLEPPLLYLSIPLALTALLLLWAGARRFGSPLAPPPRVPPGHGALIDNSARLLATGGRRPAAVRRYLRLHVRQVGERLGIPGHVSTTERVERLRAVADRRGVTDDVVDLADATRSDTTRGADLLKLARRIHTWRKEILDGNP